jgi:hypothetical protein
LQFEDSNLTVRWPGATLWSNVFLLPSRSKYQIGSPTMKTALMAPLLAALMTQALWAQQATPPAPPPGMKTKTEMGEAEILKVYAAEDQGARFRAYVIKYNGNEVIVGDDMAGTDKKVGDKIKFVVVRVEAPPIGGMKINTMQFKIMDFAVPKKK